MAALAAGCGGGTKHATTSASVTATAPVSKPVYQTRAVAVLRPMLHAINVALQTPRQASVWQGLQRQAAHAYATIGSLEPPSGVSGLNRQLVQELGTVASTAGGLFRALSSNNLASASSLGSRLIHEGAQITSLGNQLKARGYAQLGTMLAGP